MKVSLRYFVVGVISSQLLTACEGFQIDIPNCTRIRRTLGSSKPHGLTYSGNVGKGA